MSEGRKFDKGKPRVGLMFKDFARALLAVADVATYGAEKYDDSNWLKVEGKEWRYPDAEGRHLLLSHIEEFDVESKRTHLAHKAWNALADLEIHLRESEND